MELKAPINKIINFSNVDGPGNRTSIFFQTCPFECLYCHNPETIKKCINCFECVDKCPTHSLSIVNNEVRYNPTTCSNCDTCIKTCKHLSSPKIQYLTVEDVIDIIKRNKPYIRGITVSGGECTNFIPFLTELFKEVKKLGLTTFIDTNGYKDLSKENELLKYTDYVMLDLKAYDDESHFKLTKHHNEIVLSNLDYLLKINKMYEVRTVLLNNHDKENLETIKNVSKIINNRCIYKLIRYRQFGVRKEGLDKLGNYTFSKEEAEKLKLIAEEFTNKVIIN